jgi:hypothetical protein
MTFQFADYKRFYCTHTPEEVEQCAKTYGSELEIYTSVKFGVLKRDDLDSRSRHRLELLWFGEAEINGAVVFSFHAGKYYYINEPGIKPTKRDLVYILKDSFAFFHSEFNNIEQNSSMFRLFSPITWPTWRDTAGHLQNGLRPLYAGKFAKKERLSDEEEHIDFVDRALSTPSTLKFFCNIIIGLAVVILYLYCRRYSEIFPPMFNIIEEVFTALMIIVLIIVVVRERRMKLAERRNAESGNTGPAATIGLQEDAGRSKSDNE